MQKTIVLLLFLFVVSGGIFSACNSVQEEVEVSDAELEVVEEEFIEEKEEGKVEVKSEVKTEIKKEVAVPTEPVVTTKYVDGTYTQSGSYESPAGPESVTVTVTVKDDVVTGLTVTPNAVHETSQQFQGKFVAGINALVVGKKIDEIGGFAQVNGSSLTPQGFAEAFGAVKTSAVN